MTHDSCVGQDTRHSLMSLNRPTTFAGRFCRTCSNIWSSNPCGRNCRKSGTHRGDEFGLPARRLFYILPSSIYCFIVSCESFRSIIVRRCILHLHVLERGATWQISTKQTYPRASKDLFWIWQASWRSSFMGSGYQGVSKKIEYPFSSHARKCSFATRCDSTQHFLEGLHYSSH